MQKNVGNYEAIVRGVIGAGELALAVAHRSPIWLVLSALHFATAVGRYCPVNAAFGVNTYKGSQRPAGRLRAVPTVH